MRRYGVKARLGPIGIGLAALSLAIQLLLPFVLANEIAFASQAPGTSLICSASGLAASPGHRSDDGSSRHGHAGGCPICAALAAGQAFVTATPIPVPAPAAVASAVEFRRGPVRLAALPPLSYRSRAPPAA